MPDKIAFCSVAFHSNTASDAYIQQQVRLKQSIEKLYSPHEYELFFYTNEYPPGARPFLESLYGFKPHAVWHAAAKEYKHIVWLDTAMVLQQRLDFYQSLLAQYPVLAIKDETKLRNVTSDKCLLTLKLTRNSLHDNNLVGGSFYYFNLHNVVAEEILQEWTFLEMNNCFGSQDEESAGQLQGHRHDEACMALSMYKHGIKPIEPELAKYNREDGIMIKKHFK